MNPMTKRAARAWVRQHWQTFMRHADIPDLPSGPWGELLADVFCDESCKLAERLEPRPRSNPKAGV